MEPEPTQFGRSRPPGPRTSGAAQKSGGSATLMVPVPVRAQYDEDLQGEERAGETDNAGVQPGPGPGQLTHHTGQPQLNCTQDIMNRYKE